jgi:phosphoglycolate phosphatase
MALESLIETSSPIAGILFDKDGTLLDYRRSWVAINRAAADIAAEGNPDFARRLLIVGGADPDTDDVASDSVLAVGSASDIAACWRAAGSRHPDLGAALDALFRRSVDRVVPVTDLAALFAGLAARGLKLGIASSDNEAAIRATAARFGLDPYLHFVAGYDTGHGTKPGAGMVLGFCAAVGVAASAVAVVGDNPHDMEMARAAGAGLRVGVLTGTGTRASLAACAHVCLDSIDDLPGLLAAPPKS